MKGTFIIHLRVDEKCIWVHWKGKKNSAGAAADWVPCWWKVKNERFNLTDLYVKLKKEEEANINWKPACLCDCKVNSADLLTDNFGK